MFARHWRGETPILTATLGVGVLGTIALVSIGRLILYVGNSAGLSLPQTAALDLAWFTGCFAVWLWAAVGIWRSAGALKGRNKAVPRLILVVASLALLPLAKSSIASAEELEKLVRGHDPLGVPASVRVSGDTLIIDGVLAEGSAQRLTDMLARSRVSTVLVTSPGGRIIEAQQIAALIRKYGLNTEAKGLCASACTLVLLAGKQRVAWPEAKIGFHQSTFAGNDAIDDDVETEEVRSAFRAASISSSFIAKAFSTPAGTMWYPSEEQMLAAGFLTEPSIAKLLRLTSDRLAMKLPVKIDAVTVLQGVQATGRTLTYKYVVDSAVDRRILESAMQTDLRRRSCADRGLAHLITDGATLKFDYFDRNGRSIASVTVNKCAAAS